MTTYEDPAEILAAHGEWLEEAGDRTFTPAEMRLHNAIAKRRTATPDLAARPSNFGEQIISEGGLPKGIKERFKEIDGPNPDLTAALSVERLARALPYWRDGNRETCVSDARAIIANLEATAICGVIWPGGPNGEPLACAYPPNPPGERMHEHSWAWVPTPDAAFAPGALTPESLAREMHRHQALVLCFDKRIDHSWEDCREQPQWLTVTEDIVRRLALRRER